MKSDFFRQSRLPVYTGILAVFLLGGLFLFRALDSLSANTDHPALGHDYFSLPRAGLAIRFGTDPMTSWKEYGSYGPSSSDFNSHPVVAVLGVPFSYLPPWTGYWVLNLFHFLLHLLILWKFGALFIGRFPDFQTGSSQIRNVLFFTTMGLFFPWYVLYFEGQYHSFAVLALSLVLLCPRYQVHGFLLSAITKPVLAPAGLVLLIRREWKLVAVICCATAIILLPWFYLTYSIQEGITFGANELITRFYLRARGFMHYAVLRWDQQISLAQALNELCSYQVNLYIRYALAAVPVLAGVVLFLRRPRDIAIVMTTLWFFILYARGHEYHATLLVPILLCLFVQEDGRYQTWTLLVITLLLASPTVWILFTSCYGLPGPGAGSMEKMRAMNSVLYHLFLWQKPFAVLWLVAYMLYKEWPYFPRRKDQR